MRECLNLPTGNNLSKIELRVLSQFLSTAYLSNFLRQGQDTHKKKLKRFLTKKNILFDGQKNIGGILDHCYSILLNSYRNEYTYKNELVKNFITDKFKLSETIVLNEFKVNKSIVDTVLLNGVDKAFEIKTELDNPDRLVNQLLDYKKAFKYIYLVTHVDHLKKYAPLLSEEIGVISFTDQMNLVIIKEATENPFDLCIETMMRCLRKSEYLQLILKFFNAVPEVSNIELFKTCVSWAKQIDPIVFQTEFISILKRRRLIDTDIFECLDIPVSLTYAYHSLNLSENQYISLIKALKTN